MRKTPIMRIEKFLKAVLLTIIFMIPGITHTALAKANYDYQLYKNHENFGILIFPKSQIFPELDKYIQKSGFDHVESGEATMRFGLKNQNQTFMMPQSVQKKYSMNRFIILQVIANQNIMIGIFDPKFGLTLPSLSHNLGGIKENIPKTLNLFRKHLKKREAKVKVLENFKRTRLLTQNPVNIIDKAVLFK